MNISTPILAYMAYKTVRLLKMKWTNWEAYKLGLIDDKGNKLREPITTDENAALNPMYNLLRKVKKVLEKYLGGSLLLATLIGAYLLKENVENANEIRTSLQEELTDHEMEQLGHIVLQLQKMKFKDE
jgi:uncharacterized protein YdaL